MTFKSALLVSTAAVLCRLAQAGSAPDFPSTVDPNNINLPSAQQLTSYDPTQECQAVTTGSVTFNTTEWPEPWQIATSKGMNTSTDFLNAYNAIDWTKAPKINQRQKGADGALVMTGYDTTNDPDCWWSATKCTKPKTSGIPKDIVNCPEPQTWGLTFDDGPNCSHNAFYDYLKQNNQKASMFYIGSNVMNWPYGAQRGVKDGHHISVHTWSHNLMTTLSNQEVFAELYYTQKVVKYVTGITPLYWRPAQGDLDDRVRWIASQLGMTAILWNLDTNDWKIDAGLTQAQIESTYKDFINMGANGTFSTTGNIVLQHEINNKTMGFAIQYYPDIKKAYKSVVDVATCMNITHPYKEQTVSFTGIGVSPSGSSAGQSRHDAAMNLSLFIAILFSVVAFF